MRLDKCRQCVRRRIQCDGATPQCAKCVKKGIACSGVGLRYRFVNNNALPKTASNQAPRKDSMLSQCTMLRSNDPAILRESKHDSFLEESGASSGNLDRSPSSKEHTAQDCLYMTCAETASVPFCNVPSNALVPVSAQCRMLFDYFSSTIAPAMVLIDSNLNGYRNIILPLATRDYLVQRAVCVVAALHLGQKHESLFQAAEKGRSAIISRLRQDASGETNAQSPQMSTWTALILLLVGETVTGGSEFAHLFPILQCFLEHANCLTKESTDLVDFLRQQSQMFGLFTPPFLGPNHAVTALQGHLDDSLTWITCPDVSLADAATSASLLRQAIYVARDLYLHEIHNCASSASRCQAIEKMIQLADGIDENTPGMHAWVWCYFIAGAASSDPEHQQFFLRRLKQIYTKTRMCNILATIALLEGPIWHSPTATSWAYCPEIYSRTLIM